MSVKEYYVPLLQESIDNLGPQLSKIILNTMSQRAQSIMGVKKPLSEHPESMWIDPQTRIDDPCKLFFTESPEGLEVLQAFTHETIMKLGEGIERKRQCETDDLVRRAIEATEEFERWECRKRVSHAVQTERRRQQRDREYEQCQMRAAFALERKQLIDSHIVRCQQIVRELRAQLEKEYDERLQAEVKRLEQAMLEVEIKWQLELALLNVFIADAQKRQDTAVSNTRNEYLLIFKKLYNSFKVELQQQRDKMHCKHMAELLQVVCTERFAMEELERHDLREAIVNTDPEPPPPRECCPNVPVFRKMFSKLLKQYKEFIEYTQGETHNQGRYLVMFENYLKALRIDEHEPDGLYTCCAEKRPIEVDICERIRAGPTVDNNERIVFFPTAADCPPPDNIMFDPSVIQTAPCVVRSDEVMSDKASISSSASSSLSCFDVDGQMYASNKNYAEVMNRLFPGCSAPDPPKPVWINLQADDKTAAKTSSEQLAERFHANIDLTIADMELDLQALADHEGDIKFAAMQRRLRGLVVEVMTACSARSFGDPRASISKPNTDLMIAAVDSLDLLKGNEHSDDGVSLRSLQNTLASDRFTMVSGQADTSMVTDCTAPYTSAPDNTPEATIICADKPAPPTETATTQIPTRSEIKLYQEQRRADQLRQKTQRLSLSADEYKRSRQSSPSYMTSTTCRRSPDPIFNIWDKYKVSTDEEWMDLLAVVEKQMPDMEEVRLPVADGESIVSNHNNPSLVSIAGSIHQPRPCLRKPSISVSVAERQMRGDAEPSTLMEMLMSDNE